MTGLGGTGLDKTGQAKESEPSSFFSLNYHTLFFGFCSRLLPLPHLPPSRGSGKRYPVSSPIIIVFFPRALFFSHFPFSGRLGHGKDTKVLGYNLGFERVGLACGLCVHDEIPGIRLIRKRTGFFSITCCLARKASGHNITLTSILDLVCSLPSLINVPVVP